jgi:integrase
MKIPTIKFVFDRRHTAGKDKGYVEMVITHNRQRKFISTGVNCYSHQWKDDAKHNLYVSGTGADLEVNQILLTMYQRVYKIVTGMVETDTVDISAIPTLLRAQSVDMTFLEYIVKRMEKKNVVDYTKASYKGFYNKLCEFGQIKFFSDINERAIRDFDEWLHKYTWTETDRFGNKVERKYSQATIGSYHKNLKNFIADAVVDGFLKENIYVARGIKVSKGDARIDKYLTPDELHCIEVANMPTRALAETRDLFVFACHTGLSFVDLMEFDVNRVVADGEISIYKGCRHKTGITFVCPITNKAQEILDRYNGHLPKLPNQKYNVRLKLIADAAGIEKPISSHYSRHTAASIWLNEGIPIEVISKALGHSNTQLTERVYSKMFDDTIVSAFAKRK